MRDRLEQRCEALGLPAVSAIDPVVAGLSIMLGKAATARPGRQHKLDDAYFARVEAINYTMAHDDGQQSENWNEADILLARRFAHVEDADQHLSRQSRLQDGELSARYRDANRPRFSGR